MLTSLMIHLIVLVCQKAKLDVSNKYFAFNNECQSYICWLSTNKKLEKDEIEKGTKNSKYRVQRTLLKRLNNQKDVSRTDKQVKQQKKKKLI